MSKVSSNLTFTILDVFPVVPSMDSDIANVEESLSLLFMVSMMEFQIKGSLSWLGTLPCTLSNDRSLSILSPNICNFLLTV